MRPRLAWFSPVPPTRSGISAYSAEILPLLESACAIDVFVDDAGRATGVPGPAVAALLDGADGVFPAREFVPRHARHAYDLTVYQLGNARCHDYMWPYLLRYRGLVVLHDLALHHSRAMSLLQRGRRNHYRAEFRWAHPAAGAGLAEAGVAGLPGILYYLWPMTRIALSAGRLVAVHDAALAAALTAENPGLEVRAIRMGVRDVTVASRSTGPDEGLVLACYGLVTPEKRIPQVLRAFAAAAPRTAKLLLVGDAVAHYEVSADIEALGLADRVTVTGFVPDVDLDGWLARADLCLCLRWPTARETSASWLRCLAAGKPTIITDLLQTVAVPTLDPRSWTLAHTSTAGAAVSTPPTARNAVAVSIDILDEDHSLGLALRRLTTDSALREDLGRTARAWWADHHQLSRMAEDYRTAIDEALGRPVPAAPPDWPPHLLADGSALARQIAAEVGVGIDVLDYGVGV